MQKSPIRQAQGDAELAEASKTKMQNANSKFKNIRRAVVAGQPIKLRLAMLAGQFYPEDTTELESMLDEYLKQALSSDIVPQIVIVPHAGYVYSGRVAAYAFKTLQNSGYKRVVLISRSHQQYFDGVAADDSDIWQSPLGGVAVDKDFIKQLTSSASVVKINSGPHAGEHSLEVELPFLQKVLGKGIKIVPLLFGDDNSETSLALADALGEEIDKDTVVVISSDLSHYPKYEDANYLDKKTIEAILTGDSEKFQRKIRELEILQKSGVATLACAEPAIITGLALVKKLGLEGLLLKYANSGDYFSETKNRVVGYAALVFYEKSQAPTLTDLTEVEQEVALQIARKSLEAAFDEKDYKPQTTSSIFQEKRGVFVTLKKQGQLRGCIGNFTPDIDLAENIKEMALSAAFGDPRFMPLVKQELKDIEIEISVLSPMKKITDPNLIEVGKHGVYIRKGARGGVYLPQVATELGWDREQFLNSLCQEKAGLNKDCWKDGSIDLYIFTAQVFNGRRVDVC